MVAPRGNALFISSWAFLRGSQSSMVRLEARSPGNEPAPWISWWFGGKTAQTKEFSSDSLLQKTQLKEFSADAMLEKNWTKEFSGDAILTSSQPATYTKEFAADAVLTGSYPANIVVRGFIIGMYG